MTKEERFEGCIIGGAIGDAWGSSYENFVPKNDDRTLYPFGKMKAKEHKWQITDDTQLTLATCEAIILNKKVTPQIIASTLLQFYKEKKMTGIGASTLKAIRELEAGGHWSQVGRKGEYAAGNGAAMRIAPLAFYGDVSEKEIYEICSITHQNDEAYVGALCIIIAIKEILNENWTGSENLFEMIIRQIPDTRVRDRLIEIEKIKGKSLAEIGLLGNDGYVVNSVPLAIAAASKVNEMGLEEMFKKLIEIGGDTDTNCSMAGQVAGALLGNSNIPFNLKQQLSSLDSYFWIKDVVERVVEKNRR